ncbi:MAG TPA: BrnT family toxin [Candidatus Dormibacteraeota bacterium]|nr:BrnT family toxin [Candidatus Dormibacteraeota bacterium]
MRFEWDEAKNQLNLRKHDVGFETATLAFDDPYALTERDAFVEDEERWNTLGAIAPGVVLFVVHTWVERDREEVIRIISARLAESHERRNYEEAQQGAKTRYRRAHRKTGRGH